MVEDETHGDRYRLLLMPRFYAKCRRTHVQHPVHPLMPRFGSFRYVLWSRDIISQIPMCVDVENQGLDG
jgi:hypothetical protein